MKFWHFLHNEPNGCFLASISTVYILTNVRYKHWYIHTDEVSLVIFIHVTYSMWINRFHTHGVYHNTVLTGTKSLMFSCLFFTFSSVLCRLVCIWIWEWSLFPSEEGSVTAAFTIQQFSPDESLTVDWPYRLPLSVIRSFYHLPIPLKIPWIFY